MNIVEKLSNENALLWKVIDALRPEERQRYKELLDVAPAAGVHTLLASEDGYPGQPTTHTFTARKRWLVTEVQLGAQAKRIRITLPGPLRTLYDGPRAELRHLSPFVLDAMEVLRIDVTADEHYGSIFLFGCELT
jgi:hypothetical protein